VGLVAGRRHAHALALIRLLECLRRHRLGDRVGLLAYLLGNSAGNLIQAFGLYGLAAFVLAVAGAFFAHRRHRRSLADAAEQATAKTKATNQPQSGSEPPQP